MKYLRIMKNSRNKIQFKKMKNFKIQLEIEIK